MPNQPTPRSRRTPGQPVANPLDRERWIAEAAYFLSQRRGFVPGYELQDWLEAEQAFKAQGVIPARKRTPRRKPPEFADPKARIIRT